MAHVQESLIILAASVTGDSGNVTVTGLDATNSYVLPTVTPGDTLYYSILTDGAGNWEFGLGTWTSAGNGTTTFGTFARTSPIKSKAGVGVPANFSGAPVTMIFDIPAEKALFVDGSNNIVNGEFVAKAAIALDFADLVARKVPTSNNVVFRIGYGRTQNDGLGGFFIWKSGDATAADDHTTAVTVNTLAPAIGTGRYLRVFEAFVPASIADEAQIPTGGIAQSTATNELRRLRPLIGAEASAILKTIPQVENYYQGSYATLAALLAVASTKWRNGDRVQVRGILADKDLKVPLDIFWNASDTSTSATELGVNKWRPDDISGGNAGRWNISAPNPAIKFADSDATPDVSQGEVFVCADAAPAAITTFDGFRDGKRILVRPGAQNQVFIHSSTFVFPNALPFTLKITDAPIFFEKENGVIRMIGGGGLPNIIPNSIAASALVISSGSVTPTRAVHFVTSETGTSDNLRNVVVGSFPIGGHLRLQITAGHTITIETGLGNIVTDTGSNMVLDANTPSVDLYVDAAGTGWTASRSGGHDIISTFHSAIADAAAAPITDYGATNGQALLFVRAQGSAGMRGLALLTHDASDAVLIALVEDNMTFQATGTVIEAVNNTGAPRDIITSVMRTPR